MSELTLSCHDFKALLMVSLVALGVLAEAWPRYRYQIILTVGCKCKTIYCNLIYCILSIWLFLTCLKWNKGKVWLPLHVVSLYNVVSLYSVVSEKSEMFVQQETSIFHVPLPFSVSHHLNYWQLNRNSQYFMNRQTTMSWLVWVDFKFNLHHCTVRMD